MHFYQVGQLLSTVYPLHSQFLCSRVTRLIGCRATIQQLQRQITYGRDSSVGRASDRNARHNTDTGSSPRRGKGLNFLHFILDSITKGRKVHDVKYKSLSADHCAKKKKKKKKKSISGSFTNERKMHAFNYDSKSEAENLHFTAATLKLWNDPLCRVT